jgi:hypothetical protein
LTARIRTESNTDIWSLLCEIIQDTPKLDGALCCNGSRDLFLTDAPDVEACGAICACCPALEECRSWATDSENLLTGFVGGQLYEHNSQKPARPRHRIRKPADEHDSGDQ